MSSEVSTREFVRRFQDSKRGQSSHCPALDPLPNDADINRGRDAFSSHSGDSSHVFDYGRSLQSDRTATRSLTAQDTDLVGIGGADNTLHQRSRLGDLLSRAMLEGQSKRWLPESELLRLCQPGNIRKELTATFGDSDGMKLFHYVCPLEDAQTDRSACKIFAILLLINELKELKQFVKCGYCDKDLPFTWFDSRNRRQILCPRNQPFSRNQDSEHKTCFLEGGDRFMHNFYREQWQVHIPFISMTKNERVVEYELHDDTIMPWTFREDVRQQSGYSDVYKVEIHPGHHSFGVNKTFALKVLHSTDPKDLERELYALRKTPPGPHVIELLATFKRGSELSFLFPWAEGGNLADLMSKEPSEVLPSTANPSEALTEWLAEQCAGLVKGLSRIHKVESNTDNALSNGQGRKDDYGIHGDVKPENILRFLKDGGFGELKLSDFGLTRFHTKASRSNQPGNGPMSPTYAAPEQTGNWLFISRKTDVQVPSRTTPPLAKKRQTQVEKQAGIRTHFTGRDTPKMGSHWSPDGFFLKKAVFKCIEMNKDAISGPDRKCNYLTQFLDFIRDRMLQIHSNERATSKEVCQFLDENMKDYRKTRSSITLPTLNRP
ncbi:hypothetical protein FSOLCH5_015029 [Fusarium solani]